MAVGANNGIENDSDSIFLAMFVCGTQNWIIDKITFRSFENRPFRHPLSRIGMFA